MHIEHVGRNPDTSVQKRQLPPKGNFLGCSPLINKSMDFPISYRSKECTSSTDSNVCKEGFPWYRNVNVKSAEECYNFCVSKSLDLAGYVKYDDGRFECRCGASEKSSALFNEIGARKELQFETANLQKPDGSSW